MTPEQSDYMDRAVYALRRDAITAGSTIATTSNWPGSGPSKDAAKYGVATVSKGIVSLDTVLRARVASADGYTFERWVAYAKELHASLRYYVATVGEWSVAGVIGSTVAATKNDIADKLPSKFSLAIVGVLVVVALVAIAVLKVR